MTPAGLDTPSSNNSGLSNLPPDTLDRCECRRTIVTPGKWPSVDLSKRISGVHAMSTTLYSLGIAWGIICPFEK